MEVLLRELKSAEMSGWGLARVDDGGSPWTCAAVMFMAYDIPASADPLGGGAYDEAMFHDALLRTRDEGLGRIALLRSALLSAGVASELVPTGQDPVTLVGPFSIKRAAVEAGLGWIGKSSLLVTPEHGPRVRLFALLTDAGAPEPGPQVENGCGVCMACVDSCPYGCLTGNSFNAGSPRDELIDAGKCSAIMEELGEHLGHKHSCGVCLLSCPLGRIHTRGQT
jgi:epoxyqueuosine reductase